MTNAVNWSWSTLAPVAWNSAVTTPAKAAVDAAQVTELMKQLTNFGADGVAGTARDALALRDYLKNDPTIKDKFSWVHKVGNDITGTDAKEIHASIFDTLHKHLKDVGGAPEQVSHTLTLGVPGLFGTGLAGYAGFKGIGKGFNEAMYAAGIKDRPVTQNFFVNAVREVLKGQKTFPVLIAASGIGAGGALLLKNLMKQGERKAEQAGQRFEQRVADRVVEDLPTI